MHAREVTGGREFVARLAYGADWVEEIEALAVAEGVDAGWFVATGAVEDAELAYYDQDAFAPVTATYEEPLEVASCTGTIALVDGAPEAAVHAVLSRPSGQSVAGRLSAATVFDGDEAVGEVTRAAESPMLDRPVALAVVGWDAATSDSLRVDGVGSASVEGLPFYEGSDRPSRLPAYE